MSRALPLPEASDSTPLDLLTPWWLRLLAVGVPLTGAVVYAAAALLGPTTTASGFAFATSAPSAMLIGCFFVGVSIVGVATLVSASWRQLSENLVPLGIFLTAAFGAVFAGRDGLAPAGAPIVARALGLAALPTLALSLLLIGATLIVSRRALRRAPTRVQTAPDSLPPVVRGTLLLVAALCAAAAMVLWFYPSSMGVLWPWPLVRLDRLLFGAFGLGIGAAMVTVAYSTQVGQLSQYAAMAFCSTMGPILGIFLYPEQVPRGLGTVLFLGPMALGATILAALTVRLYRLRA